MSKVKRSKIEVQGTTIGILSPPDGDYISLKDIAFEFGSWLSPEFKLNLIREFQRLKDDENNRLKLDWNLQRTLATDDECQSLLGKISEAYTIGQIRATPTGNAHMTETYWQIGRGIVDFLTIEASLERSLYDEQSA